MSNIEGLCCEKWGNLISSSIPSALFEAYKYSLIIYCHMGKIVQELIINKFIFYQQ